MLIISASGMATGGRVLHHLRRHLPDPRATVILAGYQAIGTRGRALEEGATSLRIFGHEVPVRAHIETLQGLSAHADADGLLRWLRTTTRAPRCVFVIHGDPVPAQTLAARIKGELGWTVAVPKHGESVSLDQISPGDRVLSVEDRGVGSALGTCRRSPRARRSVQRVGFASFTSGIGVALPVGMHATLPLRRSERA